MLFTLMFGPDSQRRGRSSRDNGTDRRAKRAGSTSVVSALRLTKLCYICTSIRLGKIFPRDNSLPSASGKSVSLGNKLHLNSTYQATGRKWSFSFSVARSACLCNAGLLKVKIRLRQNGTWATGKDEEAPRPYLRDVSQPLTSGVYAGVRSPELDDHVSEWMPIARIAYELCGRQRPHKPIWAATEPNSQRIALWRGTRENSMTNLLARSPSTTWGRA